jgi:hypothetical protein
MPPLPEHFLEKLKQMLKQYKVAVVYYTAILITIIVLRLYGVI